jgi:hypothetical protein
MLPDLAGLVRELAEARIRYIVIGGNLTVTTSVADLEIAQRLPGVPSYSELERNSWEAELSGPQFRVCSRAHLIEMKRARGAAIDLADLERLESD